MMILKLLFILDQWLGVTDINNARSIKKISKEPIYAPLHSTKWWD